MNWSLLLSEFPRSILKDELPLEIVALLERGGLTTEEELASSLKVEPHELHRALLDLKMNQCIEYGRHYVKLTYRGKLLVDRFKLKEAVLDDLLDSLDLRGEEREDFKQIILSYREDAFRYYLNSLSSIKTWKALVEGLPKQKNDPKNEKQENQIGMLTLLLRDLRNWWLHSNLSESLLDGINDDLRNLLTTVKLLDEPKPKLTFHSRLDVCNDVLSGWEHGYQKTSYLISPGSPLGKGKANLLLYFHTFQASAEPDNWFDSFYDAQMNWKRTKKLRNINDYIVGFQTTLESKPVLIATINTGGEITKAYSRNWHIEFTPRRRAGNNLIETILLSSTFDELAETIGYEKTMLFNLLTELEEKCRSLLNEFRQRSEHNSVENQ